MNTFKQRDNTLAVLPTGAGKSAVIAMLADAAVRHERNMLVLTHSKELVVQNHAELKNFFGHNAGIYSASAERKDVGRQVTFGSIQSVFRSPELFAPHLILVDEAHLISQDDDSMYRKFLSGLPKHKIIGLTATPYRLKQGLLTDGENALFDNICYEIGVRDLVDREYLSPLTTFGTRTERDMSGVKTVAGEYKLDDMAKRFEGSEIVKITCDELNERAQERKKILIFASSLLHADQIAEYLNFHLGLPCHYVDGKMSQERRDGEIESFKAAKERRALVNYGVLTTGFNVPAIDCIALMRATQSTGLYVQMLGRGMRRAEGKENCLVLDFGQNIIRHGPIDAIEIRAKEKGEGKEIVVQPTKLCPNCMADNHARATTCHNCGYAFPVAETIQEEADTETPVMKETVKFTVTGWRLNRHEKPGKTPSMRVTYDVKEQFTPISEWVCVEHVGFARKKAVEWFNEHCVDAPDNVDDAMEAAEELEPPSYLSVEVGGRFPQIKSRIF